MARKICKRHYSKYTDIETEKSGETVLTNEKKKCDHKTEIPESYFVPINDLIRLTSIQTGENYSEIVSEKDFLCLKLLGEGFSGSVYLVEKKVGLDKRKIYAMKTMIKSQLKTQAVIRHVVREREILARIGSLPYVTSLHYAFQNSERLFLVFDYVCGGDLRNRLNDKLMTAPALKKIIAQIAIGINALHTNNIIHRDLKPDNILLDKQGNVVIVDLGFAKTFEGYLDEKDKCYVQTICGTPCYMAPEIACTGPYNFMIDIWAIGVITYELIMGKPMFITRDEINEEYLIQVMLKLHYEIQDPHARDFIRRICEWDPKNRMSHEDIRLHPFLENMDWYKLTHAIKPQKIKRMSDLNNKQDCILKPLEVPTWTHNLYHGYMFIHPKHIRMNYKVAEKPEIEEFNLKFIQQVKRRTFSIVKELYKGSFGRFYTILHRNQSIPDQGFISKKISKVQFRNEELTALILLKSDFICSLRSCHQDKENYYLIIENLQGGTLLEFIGMGKSEREIYPICEQICKAITFMHQKHFIHGDINPTNIVFVDRSQRQIKIVDFGNASYCRGVDFWHDVPRYTLDYAPPEALVHENSPLYSKLFDIWSFGATLYHMFMGHPPFRTAIDSNESESIVKDRILNESHICKSNRMHKATALFKNFFQGCLKKDIKKRLRTYELLNDRWFYAMPFYEGDV